MAKRTTKRRSRGTKLYAVRGKDGKFRDIQTYKRTTKSPEGPYRAEPCGCPYLHCSDWHVYPVAAVQGVCFTKKQAEAVAAFLNSCHLTWHDW